MAGEPVASDPAAPPSPPGRRDAVRNYHRILEAARDVLGESGADASMEEIAARAGVGVGTVYRRFANKDALIDELLRLSMAKASPRPGRPWPARAATASSGCCAGSGRCSPGTPGTRTCCSSAAPTAPRREIRAAVEELTGRALAAGTLNPCVTVGDVMALIWAMRGLTETTGEVAPGTWQRFLDIHLAGLRAPGPLSATPSMSAGQLAELLPRP